MENKLMIKLVVATEAILFISLMITYVYFALHPGYSKQSLQMLDIKSTGAFSILLFASSFTFWRAEVNYKRSEIKKLKMWLGSTILLGMIFLFGQAKEYWRLLHQHLTVSTDIFGTNFYTLTGFHSFHVLVGLILLIIILLLSFEGDFDEPRSSVISTVGIYWHFVDVVWLFVFTLVYVSPLIFKL